MTGSGAMRCCGRTMTEIGVEQAAGELRLHSCPSCGTHAWRNGGRAVERSELLRVLRPAPRVAASRAVPPPVPEAAPAGDADRRTELRRLLDGFTVHGTTS